MSRARTVTRMPAGRHHCVLQSVERDANLQTLSRRELRLDETLLTIDPRPRRRVKAWVRIGDTPIQVAAIAASWTRDAVGLVFTVTAASTAAGCGPVPSKKSRKEMEDRMPRSGVNALELTYLRTDATPTGNTCALAGRTSPADLEALSRRVSAFAKQRRAAHLA